MIGPKYEMRTQQFPPDSVYIERLGSRIYMEVLIICYYARFLSLYCDIFSSLFLQEMYLESRLLEMGWIARVKVARTVHSVALGSVTATIF
jgi:hypothetical protein